MNGKVKEYGLAAAQQKLCNSASDDIAFAQALLERAKKKHGVILPCGVVKHFRDKEQQQHQQQQEAAREEIIKSLSTKGINFFLSQRSPSNS
jgi:hypothetical protein